MKKKISKNILRRVIALIVAFVHTYVFRDLGSARSSLGFG